MDIRRGIILLIVVLVVGVVSFLTLLTVCVYSFFAPSKPLTLESKTLITPEIKITEKDTLYIYEIN